VVAHDARRVARIAEVVGDGYRWLHASGYYNDSARERVGHARRHAKDGSLPGPTAETAASREKVRDKLAEAAEATKQARAKLGVALEALHKVAAIVDAGAEHLPSDHDRRIPRTESKAGVRQATRAKARRKARGEGWGEG